MSVIRTPESHPDDHVVGQKFWAWNSETYLCESYDPACGYWMKNINDASDRRNVSERAIGRTYHRL